ncbi:MAG: hypothetical protein AAFP82_13330, partial [Bacteroidota bacterium]
SLHTDSLSYVYKKVDNAFVKQEVLTSESNDNEVIVELGVETGDEVLLSIPENGKDFEFVYLDAEIKKEYKEKMEKEKRARQAAAMEKASKVKDERITADTGGGGGFVIFN